MNKKYAYIGTPNADIRGGFLVVRIYEGGERMPAMVVDTRDEADEWADRLNTTLGLTRTDIRNTLVLTDTTEEEDNDAV